MATCFDCGSDMPDAAHACPSCGWIRDRRDAEHRAGDSADAARFGAAMRGLHDGPPRQGRRDVRVVAGVAAAILVIAAVAVWLFTR